MHVYGDDLIAPAVQLKGADRAAGPWVEQVHATVAVAYYYGAQRGAGVTAVHHVPWAAFHPATRVQIQERAPVARLQVYQFRCAVRGGGHSRHGIQPRKKADGVGQAAVYGVVYCTVMYLRAVQGCSCRKQQR